MELKKCNICELKKEIVLFPKSGKGEKYRACCKECWNDKNRKRYIPGKYNSTRQKWRNNNKEHLNKYANNYKNNRKKIDSLYKLKCQIRTLMWETFRKKKFVKKSKTFNILGCNYEFFKSYIEEQFTEDMNWYNIHLDHIKPLKLATTYEEVIQLNHYTNFQPLLAIDNLKKSSKWK